MIIHRYSKVKQYERATLFKMVEFIYSSILSIDLVVLVGLFLQLSTHYSRYKIKPGTIEKANRLEDTPTVSLCIPARNETHALADCLTSAVSSDYPKLEIIVLDDCSQDKTSEIIRGFAHDGVRFVRGEAPSDSWLGKNNAYQTLQDQAKGDYLVFMSVDTRVEPASISRLIAYMQLEKLSMTSVLPRRYDNLRSSVIFAPLRYFWQVVTPLKFNTPVATSLWSIRSDDLKEIGGFSRFKDKVDVENRLASQLSVGDEYHFLIANDLLQASYQKTWQSQADTAIRLWYPNLNQNYLFAFCVVLAHLLLFVLPFVIVVQSLLSLGSTNGYIKGYWVIAPIVCILSGYIYLLYFCRTKNVTGVKDYIVVLVSFFAMPYLALQESALIVTSFVQYKRGKVNWKGRNICYPTIQRY